VTNAKKQYYWIESNVSNSQAENPRTGCIYKKVRSLRRIRTSRKQNVDIIDALQQIIHHRKQLDFEGMSNSTKKPIKEKYLIY
jgi:hypothetical protein